MIRLPLVSCVILISLSSRAADVNETIASNTTWFATNGAYVITGNVSVGSNAVLTIEPGVTVLLGEGASLVVNGRLLAEGTEQQRIRFARMAGATSWAQMAFVNGRSESTLAYVDIEYAGAGGAPNIHATNSILSLDHVVWTNTASQLLDLRSSSITMRNSILPSIENDELIHFFDMPPDGHVLIEGNIFGNTSGHNDIVDFTGGNRPGPIARFINNVFTAAVDDVLDFDSSDAHIEGNIFLHVHQDAARPSSS